MATSFYTYTKNETLTKIANRFNTDVTTLVRLNTWLKDPVDGHTYMIPGKATAKQSYSIGQFPSNTTSIGLAVFPKACSIVIYVTNSEDKITKYVQNLNNTFTPVGTIDKYDDQINAVVFNSFDDIKKIIIEYTPQSISDSIIVPLVGNGNTSAEDYWDSVDSILGLAYNNTLDNFMAKSLNTNALSSDNTTSSQIDSRIFASYPASLDKYTTDFVADSIDANPNKSLLIYDVSDFAVADIGSAVQAAIYNSSPSTNYKPWKYRRRVDGPNWAAYNAPTPEKIRGIAIKDTINRFSYTEIGDINSNMYGKCKVTITDVASKTSVTLNMPCYPESVTDSVGADYTPNTPLGRSEPFNTYVNTSERSIDFSFDMHREMTGNRADIETIVNYIESAVYPDYSNQISPIRVQVDIAGQIYISGFVPKASVEWFGAIGDDYKYNQVKINFTVTEATGVPKSAGYIQSHGSYRN